MRSGLEQRLVLIALLTAVTLASCTSAPSTPPPAAQASPAAKPAAAASPATASSPAPAAPRPAVGGGAAQPRANPTFAAIGGSGIIIVPTPNFAVQATAVPAPFAQAVSLQTVQPANVVLPVGTLSRIPTAIPAPAGAVQGSAAGSAAAAGGGGGGGGAALLTIGVNPTSTPLVRIQPQPQPTIAFPPR